MTWQLLVTRLSGTHGALRLRFWRALKAGGAAALRDGVYIAPEGEAVSRLFSEQAAEIVASGGSAFLMSVPALESDIESTVVAMFDRSAQYGDLDDSVTAFLRKLPTMSEGEARRALRQLNREFSLIEAMDFFPTDARSAAVAQLRDAETALSRVFSPEEPTATHVTVFRRNASDFQTKRWATRAHLWIDRVASAWLIRRFIDPQASFCWLQRAADCPSDAIGFDFDGAAFTHVENYVTFEVLLRSFGLDDDPALLRLGSLVHQLDVGVGRVPEAAGLEAIVAGSRERCRDDDVFLSEMSRIFEDLYVAFSRPSVSTKDQQ
jgi:hypothetical protein